MEWRKKKEPSNKEEADGRKPKLDSSSSNKRDGKQGDATTESCSVSSLWTIDALFSSSCIAAMPWIGPYIEQGVRHISNVGHQVAGFLSPARPEWQSKARIFWEDAAASSPMDWMMKHFDTNGDGHISPSELVNMTDILKHLPHLQQESWTAWFRREWPLLDWKVGLFLWRSFGGILCILTVLTIIPGRLHGISARILRWPLLAIVYFLIVVELIVYTVIRLFIRAAEYLIARPRHRKLRRSMMHAKNYSEWYSYAKKLDQSQKRDRWLDTYDTSERYNWAMINELISEMKKARETNDALLALAVLQQCTRKNVGGIMSGDLFSYTNTGEPKHIVNDFIDEVSTCARWLTNECNRLSHSTNGRTANSQEESKKQAYDSFLHQTVTEEKKMLWQSVLSTSIRLAGITSNDDEERHDLPTTPKELVSVFHRQEVLNFLKRARASYGRTALCFSGGAMMGLYHFGHARALIEAGVLPNIISGTSGGSVVGAILCTRTDEELLRDLDPNVLIKHITCFDRPWGERLKSLWRTGSLFSFDVWMEKIQWFSNGLTFLEAYKKTGRVFCVTLSSTTTKAPSVLLNHVTAPNVTIASAVVASAAVPGFVPPVSLQYKAPDGSLHFHDGETYWDGSIERDIPVDGLAEMFNCGYFIVCQTNPHVVPFFYNCKGAVGRPSRWSSGMQEDSWRGGFVLAALEMYLKNDMKAKMRFLRDVEAGVSFTSSMMVQEFEGSTTIVPQVGFLDYFRLFSDPKLEEIYHYYQNGSVAAYEHLALIKLHYKLADLMDECIGALENDRPKSTAVRRTKMNIPIDEMRVKGGNLVETAFADSDDSVAKASPSTSVADDQAEDEYERTWYRGDLMDD